MQRLVRTAFLWLILLPLPVQATTPVQPPEDTAAASPADAAAGCSFVISSLPADAQLFSVATDIVPRLSPGTVWIDHELIRYGHKTPNALVDVVRSVGNELGFVRAQDHPTVAETALVLDYRCVLAAK